MRYDLRPALGPCIAALKSFQRDQVPFTTALALTSLAKGVVGVGRQSILTTFDRPTPFTENAFAMQGATKSNLVARVYARPAAAAYLAPYEIGGVHFLGTKKGLLVPKAVALNQYGNLARGKLAALKGKPGVFVGGIRGKDGEMIYGVWQRLTVAQVKRAVKAGQRARDSEPVKSGGLKLLIRFEDPLSVKQRLNFQVNAAAYIAQHALDAWSDALDRALATDRRASRH